MNGKEQEISVKLVRLRQKPDLRGLCWRSDETAGLNQSADSEQLVAVSETLEESVCVRQVCRSRRSEQLCHGLWCSWQKMCQSWENVGDKTSDTLVKTCSGDDNCWNNFQPWLLKKSHHYISSVFRRNPHRSLPSAFLDLFDSHWSTQLNLPCGKGYLQQR